MNDYEIVTNIGKGSSGAVFLARSKRIKVRSFVTPPFEIFNLFTYFLSSMF